MMHAYLRLKGTIVTSIFFCSILCILLFSCHQTLLHLCVDIFSLPIGYRILSPEVEEGICQVLAHLWLESEIVSGSSSSIATTSAEVAVAAEATATPSTSSSTKKGEKTDFEKKLGEFFKHQIETDPSPTYGEGFRAGIRAVERYGLRGTLDHIKRSGSFPS